MSSRTAATALSAGDRVVVPFNISCGTCWMCGQGLHSPCGTTQVRDRGTGAAFFGFSQLYGEVPGGQAEFPRVRFGSALPDVLPTAWQAVEYAGGAAAPSSTRSAWRHTGREPPAPRAFTIAVDAVRRGGTISVIGVYGVYGGTVDPVPMMTLFDKQIQLRMGQANVKRWVDDILPLLNENDPLGVHDSATHHLPLEEAAQAYKTFQETKDGMVKTLLVP